MNFLYALFLGAGLAGFTYSKMGRRLGYGNGQNVALVVGVVFVLTTIAAYTVFALLLGN